MNEILSQRFFNNEDIEGEAFSEILSPTKGIKFSIWSHLSDMIGGFRMNELSLLCGSTGVGKSDFIANISANLCLNNIPHVVFSVETGGVDFWIRVFSVLTGREYNDGDPHDLKILQQDFEKFHEMIRKNLIISRHDDRISVGELKELISYQVETNKSQFVIMDNLNFFMDPSSDTGVNFEIDRVIHDLVVLTKRTPAHFMLICHPRKTEFTRVESEYDIKGSSTAVQEAHNVFLFNRPGEDMVAPPFITDGHRDLKISKCRRRGKNVGKGIIFGWKDRTYIESCGYDFRKKTTMGLGSVFKQGPEVSKFASYNELF